MNVNKRVPFKLKMLDTCLPDYFQGFSGPVISFPVDARMSYSELIAKLTDDDAWPANADIEDIRAAVIDLTGGVHISGSKPYYDVGPDEPSPAYFVSRHPTINDMWLVIDKQDGEVLNSWPTEKQALCEAGDENTPDVYAYFGIDLEAPAGYQVEFIVDQADSTNHYWNYKHRGLWADDYFSTEMEANVAAWRDKFSNDVTEDFIEGNVLQHSENVWTAGIHHSPTRWVDRVEINATTKEEACELRDLVLKALNA